MSTEAAADVRPSRRALSRQDYDRFLPLVRRTAMRVARRVPRHVTVNDLISAGWLGMVEAFARAAPGMPSEEFEAYALYRVRGAMLDYLRSLDPATREMRAASRRVARAVSAASSKLGREPEEQEVAAELGMEPSAYADLLGRLGRSGMARLELVDFDKADVATSEIAPDQAASEKQIAELVVGAIESLPPRLKQVLALYYQEDCTLREIGAILGVTESRACQLHTEAMHRLRATLGKE